MSGQFEEDPGRVQIWGILSAPGPKVRDKDGEYFRKVQKETRRSAHSKSVVGTKQHNTGASEVFHHERRKMWFSAFGASGNVPSNQFSAVKLTSQFVAS
jgi:hypothetical protein